MEEKGKDFELWGISTKAARFPPATGPLPPPGFRLPIIGPRLPDRAVILLFKNYANQFSGQLPVFIRVYPHRKLDN